MENNDWLQDRVAYLKGLKSPSDQQALLVLLAEKPQRTSQDEKKLAAIVRAEKASVKAAKARQDAANLINAEKKAAKEADRKARNHRLILQGVLFDLAGLENRSRGSCSGCCWPHLPPTTRNAGQAGKPKGMLCWRKKATQPTVKP